ncbi:MAG TPA: hypothetical protein VGF02_03930 [Pseudolabrys sp.]
MSWIQTLKGRAFDLSNPTPEMVDFAEIAETLARINRYAGASEKPISVAQHSLIAFDAAAPEDRAAVLLHDAHEALIGDIITPTAQEIAATLAAQAGEEASESFKFALLTLKTRIDTAIFAAAGLKMPDLAQWRRIRAADLTALATERRDFLARSPRPWAAEIEATKPLAKKYRLRPALDVADDLYSAFKTYLPALRKRAA